MATVKVTVNGVTFEGTKEDVRSILEATGQVEKGTPYYYSHSRGMVKVSDMHTAHVMNALLKIYRQWTTDLSNETDPQKLARMIHMGPESLDFANLFRELKRRHDTVIK